MNSIERMRATAAGERTDRVPFVPTIYEHAAYLIGKLPTDISLNLNLLVQAQLKAYEIYGHDFVVIGADIYNVEAEALGCRVRYYPDSAAIPGVESHILQEGDVSELKKPSPWQDGRMPMMLEAVSRVKKEIGDLVPVNGTVVGPYTLATILAGYENFVMKMLSEPEEAERILSFTTAVCCDYAIAFIKLGAGVSINESWIAQPVLSPALYRKFVYKYHQQVVRQLKEAGASSVGIISGGDTTAICDDLISVGSSILMADYCCDQKLYKQKAEAAGIVLRGSIDSKLVRSGPPEKIAAETLRLLELCARSGRFLLGCGVVPYDTPSEHLFAMKEVVENFNLR